MKRYTSVIDHDKSGPGSKIFDSPSNRRKKRRSTSKIAVSVADFNEVAVDMLNYIKEFAGARKLGPASIHIRKNEKNSFWRQCDRASLSKIILHICKLTERVFKSENRCLRIGSPCVILGDIHGNLNDLLFHERTLWPKAPASFDSSCLFLGDYVDRGEYSLEVTMYIFSMKILAPDKFNLLRGNHEVKVTNAAYTFRSECYSKFGDEIGETIFAACNHTFDHMPLCAVVDNSIFCSHGGIPSSVHKVDQLDLIQCPLSQPETQSAAAWEMLWSDPVDDDEFAETANAIREQAGSATYKKLIKTGILPNTKRGTTFVFSEGAVSKFLQVNHLSLIIRGHELVESGFNQHMGGKVITVFSSSKYSGNNEAAAILVKDDTIRIIKLRTEN